MSHQGDRFFAAAFATSKLSSHIYRVLAAQRQLFELRILCA
jgi:hypothetical protein